MSEIVAHPANEHLRIRLEIDEAPEKPYHDGGFPIWRIEHRSGGVRAVQETDITSYVTPAALDEAIGDLFFHGGARYAPEEVMRRYLRIFWGATFMETWHSGSYWYVMADPAHWREHVGVTDEVTRREDYTKHAWTEWQAWCEGNVWYAIPEQAVHRRTLTTTTYADGSTSESTDYDEAWQEIDDLPAVGGFYGDVDEDMRINLLWQFDWPAHRCKVCGKGIVNDVHVGWTLHDVPMDERGLHTNHGDDGSQHTPEERS